MTNEKIFLVKSYMASGIYKKLLNLVSHPQNYHLSSGVELTKEEIPTVDDLIKYNYLTKHFRTIDKEAKKEAIITHRKLKLLLKKLEGLK